ncbi:MAG TPA: LCP family protein, partial [Blastocatellia bacterium]|nr:LCP family protein [Blastocatellia bacterium]
MAKHLAPDDSVRTKPSIVKRILAVCAVLLAGLVAVIVGFSITQHKNPLQVVTEPFVPTPQQVFRKNNLRILVVGLDYDYNGKDEEYSTQSRSDVIKAINLDFAHKQAYVLSVPRDMEATLPNGREAKINEAQSEGGIKEAQSVISQWLGIPGFDKYVILRINSMKDIISAIGGINVDVKDSDCLMHHECTNESNLDYVDTWGHLYIHLKPGLQHLNGDQAVGYARFRHDWCGDPCRLERQDQVVRAMVDKIKGDKINTLLHLGQLINIVHNNVTTNLTQNQLFILASYFSDIGPQQMHQAQVPYVADQILADGGDAIVPDQEAKARLVRTMLIAPPVPEPSANPVVVAEIVPSTLHVDVENGSGVVGAAHKLAATLQKQGFKIGAIGDA